MKELNDRSDINSREIWLKVKVHTNVLDNNVRIFAFGTTAINKVKTIQRSYRKNSLLSSSIINGLQKLHLEIPCRKIREKIRMLHMKRCIGNIQLKIIRSPHIFREEKIKFYPRNVLTNLILQAMYY